MIARCKTLLAEKNFSLPRAATLVMHPGICREYRNAYGCFWALAEDDLERVGMTLLKVDAGIDTGGVYGYYTYDYDDVNESQNMIHNRVTFDNLPELAEKISEIDKGSAQLIDTSARKFRNLGTAMAESLFALEKNSRRRLREQS